MDGLQGEGVGASLKHYAANNQEERRMDVSVEVDERTLREIYLAAFEAVVKATNPWTVMASYNKLRGTYASANSHLLQDILKGEWGYDGVTVSDWGAVHSTEPSANGGLDLEMPGPAVYFGDRLEAAVKAGAVEPARIDDAAQAPDPAHAAHRPARRRPARGRAAQRTASRHRAPRGAGGHRPSEERWRAAAP